MTSEQTIESIDLLLTEKRSRRRETASRVPSVEQVSGLYVGPITVVSFSRVWPRLIGDLLPYEFWQSWRLSEFVVEEASGFPAAKNGHLVAKVGYEARHGDGKAMPTDRGRLRCEVRDIAEAKAINARLSGPSARIHCSETLEKNGLSEYSHWYVIERGWSIPVEGMYEALLPNGERIATLWKTRLLSFEE